MTRFVPVVILMLASGVACAADGQLGALFFTPSERNDMDRVRRGEKIGPAAVQGRPTVNGYVKRSDGLATVWIDGRETDVRGETKQGSLRPGIVGGPGETNIRLQQESRQSQPSGRPNASPSALESRGKK